MRCIQFLLHLVKEFAAGHFKGFRWFSWVSGVPLLWLMFASGIGGNLLTLKFSRSDETEADLVGMELAARAGYDPRAAVDFWKRMMQVGGNKPPEFMSTHPADSTRIAQLEAFLAMIFPIVEAEDVPGDLACRVIAPVLALGEDTGDAQLHQGSGFAGLERDAERQTLTVGRRSEPLLHPILITVDGRSQSLDVAVVGQQFFGVDQHRIHRRADGQRLPETVEHGAAIRLHDIGAYRDRITALLEEVLVEVLEMDCPRENAGRTQRQDHQHDHEALGEPPEFRWHLRAGLACRLHGVTMRTSSARGMAMPSRERASCSTTLRVDQLLCSSWSRHHSMLRRSRSALSRSSSWNRRKGKAHRYLTQWPDAQPPKSQGRPRRGVGGSAVGGPQQPRVPIPALTRN